MTPMLSSLTSPETTEFASWQLSDFSVSKNIPRLRPTKNHDLSHSETNVKLFSVSGMISCISALILIKILWHLAFYYAMSSSP